MSLKQRKIKFEPRIKLSLNIWKCKVSVELPKITNYIICKFTFLKA